MNKQNTILIFILLFVISLSSPADGSDIIAFSKVVNNNWEIVTTDKDGNSEVNLTNNPANDYYPAWSHDGKHIAFASFRDGNSEIYIMDSDGSDQRRITNDPLFDSRPSFVPDGQRLAFTRMILEDASSIEIYIIDINGENEEYLMDGMSAEWSPDGNKIAFSKRRRLDTLWSIYLADPDGKNQLDITDLHEFDPSWSPDGSEIIYSAKEVILGPVNIYKMDRYGENIVKLTQGAGQDLAPTYSPDGEYIAYCVSATRGYRIMVMKADGTELKEISQGADPSWFDPAYARKYAVNSADKLPYKWSMLKID